MSSLAGRLGSVLVLAGILLLITTFLLAYMEFSSIEVSGDLNSAISSLVWAAVKAVFLGIMGWIGSVMIARGLEALKREGAALVEG